MATDQTNRARAAARLRMPLAIAGGLATLVGLGLGEPLVLLPGVAVLLVGLALYFRLGTVRAEPVPVRPPVRGRWWALNSPADKVPSHGLHAYGQTYAIDFVHVPSGAYEIALGWSPATRAPDEFPGYGQPVLAPADGTVVRVRDRERDHRSRSSWPGLLMWFGEAVGRELAGPRRLLGNHVVIEIAPQTYALVAHLQRGSVTVRPGDAVRAGQQIAACGNTGSSTEPHVHFQLMDRPGALLAAGLPFRLTGAVGDDGSPVPLPKAGEAIVAR
jgi:murein DD-endopeptidase MepM/ murein hydrolase activator NlpD